MKRITVMFIIFIYLPFFLQAQGYLVSNDAMLTSGINALKDMKSNLLFYELANDNEKEIILTICNYYYNYLESQILINKFFSVSASCRIYVMAPCIEIIHKELLYIKENLNTRHIQNILDTVEKLLVVYENMLELTCIFPYADEKSWVDIKDLGLQNKGILF